MSALPPLALRTARLALRPLEPEDAEALHAIHSDPEVMRYWSSPPWTTLEQARASIAADAPGLASGSHARAGIVLREGGNLIGTCTLHGVQAASRRAELGYALARDHWGRGYMDEALRALVAHAFGPLGLHRLEADIDPRNAASARSLERLGFRREGHLRERWIVNGEISDSWLYGLLRHEWTAHRAA